MNDRARFDVFWIAMACVVVPMVLRLARTDITRWERHLHVLYLSVVALLPKYLRNTAGPIYFDEIAHWSQTSRLIGDGKLFAPNAQVEIIANFPGLHIVTATIHFLTGANVTIASWILLLLAKALALGGINTLGFRLTDSRRLGSFAAVFYGVGPATWFFNSMFSYQSLSIVFFIWFFVALSTLVREDPYSWGRTSWFFAALLIGVTCNVTHHLTSYMLLGVLGLYVSAHSLRAIRRRESFRNVRETIALLVLLATFSSMWALLEAPKIVSYLSPYLKDGITELTKQAEAKPADVDPDAAPTQHKFFEGSVIPLYEQLLGFAVPVVAGSLTLLGVHKRKQLRALKTSTVAIAVFSGAYFAAFPMMFSPSGNEGGRRSWAFSGVAVCVVMALGGLRLLDRKHKATRAASRHVMAWLVMILAIGNVASDVNESARFQGPYTFGSDTRGQTAEGKAVGKWMITTFGPGRRTIADRYLGAMLSLHAQSFVQTGSGERPLWDYFISSLPISDDLLSKTQDIGVEFLATDRRSTKYLPELGFQLDANEPGGLGRKSPVPTEVLDRYQTVLWLAKVYSTTNYDVYRFLWGSTPANKAARSEHGK